MTIVIGDSHRKNREYAHHAYFITIPIGIVKQFNLSEGDKLNWEIKAERGKLIIVVKPMKRR